MSLINLADVMEALADRARTLIPRSFAYPPDKISPPTFLLDLPEAVDYDGTYGRGMDSLRLTALVLVGRAENRASVRNLLPYVDGSGRQSVKALLESGMYSAMDTVHVSQAELAVYKFAAIDYLGAEFTINITGSGE
ncbi:hypothetical protein LWC34_38865 [Kibdelosporangium philippinense]|uniref:Tail terminator n=1 Tax=Kibdelosporangium philippinense TaxID=211113 RepID=A0ABS8ZMC6_9PSEU|nr:hypothetical protein [Kibdelosporangium philippinense]MCE7008732.1 hypothetical protein [Kibdelosporangium philippinense]